MKTNVVDIVVWNVEATAKGYAIIVVQGGAMDAKTLVLVGVEMDAKAIVMGTAKAVAKILVVEVVKIHVLAVQDKAMTC